MTIGLREGMGRTLAEGLPNPVRELLHLAQGVLEPRQIEGHQGIEGPEVRDPGVLHLASREGEFGDLPAHDLDVLLAAYSDIRQDGTVGPQPNTLLLSDDGRRFHRGTAAFVDAEAAASTDFAVADFDGDGDVDLVECAAMQSSKLWIQSP